MLPRNIQHYYVMNPNKTHMYGYDKHQQLRMIYNLPWLRPYLFCSAIEAQMCAQNNRAIVFQWPGRIHENSPDDNLL